MTELPGLTSMIEFASRQAEKIFRRTGVIYPMYHAINRHGRNLLFDGPTCDKDAAVAIVKAWLRANDIDRYVFFDEAWIVDARYRPGLDLEKAFHEGLRNHPDRREIVMFSAEDRAGNMLTASRFILRPEHGKPTLAPLKIDDMTGVTSAGRMVGLLKSGSRG